MTVAGAALLWLVLGLTQAWAGNVGEMLTRNTVRLALAWYAAALWLMIRMQPQDWSAESPRGRLARWCWTWGLASFLVHVAFAFHFYHQWAHAHAVAHTQEASGFGEGLYFSYLFTLLWAADVAWWWLTSERYASRPRAVDRGLHAFMLLMVFNGAVVYESGPIRWVGIAIFAGLAGTWLVARHAPQRRVESNGAQIGTLR